MRKMPGTYQNDFQFRRLFRAYPRLLQFGGRSTRTELAGYWVSTWILSYVVIFLLIGRAYGSGSLSSSFSVASLAYLLFFLPAPALHIRRIHDAGFSTGLGLLTLLPSVIQLCAPPAFTQLPVARFGLLLICVGSLVLLLWKPTDGPNRYGLDPRLDPDDFEAAPAEG